MTARQDRPETGARLARSSPCGSRRWAHGRSARAIVSCAVIATCLSTGLGTGVHARELRRSEVEAISRSEARREIQRRETTGQNVPTDVMRVGPQGRPTTVNGNGTTVTRNR